MFQKRAELERDFLRHSYESAKPQDDQALTEFLKEAIRIATEAFSLQAEILAASDIKLFDSKAMKFLDRIRSKERLYSTAFYEKYIRIVQDKSENRQENHDIIADFLINTKTDELLQDFHSWFDIVGYYAAKIKIGPIVSFLSVPRYILSYFEELREIFSFKQYRSSIILCRALLEMALYERIHRKEPFKRSDQKVTSIDAGREQTLSGDIETAASKGLLNSQKKRIAHRIRRTANKVLHLEGEAVEVTEKQTLETIRDTVWIMETLYR